MSTWMLVFILAANPTAVLRVSYGDAPTCHAAQAALRNGHGVLASACLEQRK